VKFIKYISRYHPCVVRMGLRVGHEGEAVLPGDQYAGQLRAVQLVQHLSHLAAARAAQILQRLLVSHHLVCIQYC
jgi:hypothetical protein